ncbi:hypothetical protein SAMN04487886_11517 [Clostridium sp. DSM 8431]|uniref:hypothetical protein n=1 Tax=Clostridium sp. DSM 8431 TaxID=1761781 RepID=UPI0008E7EE85|nr:hypothetical protein [Clostridium sp. DSM 8431]SFU77578.1 hypothetical protein SAMN04487886_11517 [Clostridium sp. DSM 8431]
MENENIKELEADVILEEELVREKNLAQEYDSKNNIKLKLNGLDSSSKAVEIEKKVNDLEEVDQATINFLMGIIVIIKKNDADKGELIKKVIDIVDETEAGIVVEEVPVQKKDEFKRSKDNIKLRLKGLDSPSRAVRVEEKVNALDEVQDAVMNFEMGIITIIKKDNVNKDDLIKKVTDIIDKSEAGVIIDEV